MGQGIIVQPLLAWERADFPAPCPETEREERIGKLLRAQRKMCAGQLAERGVLILSNVITRSILGLSFS